MQWIDRRRLKTEVLAGTFLNLGSASAVEIAAETGFDEISRVPCTGEERFANSLAAVR